MRHRPLLRRCIWITPLFALIAGYLSAHHTAAATRVATGVPGSQVTFEYPVHWQLTSPPPPLAAIGLRNSVTVVPQARAKSSGLLAATVAGEGNPLPAALLAKVGGRADGEAIWLVSAPAFRYRNLSFAGSDIQITAYSIPAGDGRFTLALCFASRGKASLQQRCEQIVEGSNAPQEGSGPPIELQPRADFAKELGVVLRGLQKVRSQVRARMAATADGTVLASESRRLALALSDTRLAVKTMSTPAIAKQATAALERAMLGAQLAYTALASAAESGETSRYLTLREQVEEAESGIRSAVASFGLLGYRIA
jgi:hypothetical protein